MIEEWSRKICSINLEHPYSQTYTGTYTQAYTLKEGRRVKSELRIHNLIKTHPIKKSVSVWHLAAGRSLYQVTISSKFSCDPLKVDQIVTWAVCLNLKNVQCSSWMTPGNDLQDRPFCYVHMSSLSLWWRFSSGFGFKATGKLSRDFCHCSYKLLSNSSHIMICWCFRCQYVLIF